MMQWESQIIKNSKIFSFHVVVQKKHFSQKMNNSK